MVYPGLMNIDDCVAQVWKIEKERLYERTRKREVVNARQVSIWWQIRHTKKSLRMITEVYAGLDHTAGIHSMKVVKNLMETDKVFKERVLLVEKIMNDVKEIKE